MMAFKVHKKMENILLIGLQKKTKEKNLILQAYGKKHIVVPFSGYKKSENLKKKISTKFGILQIYKIFLSSLTIFKKKKY